MSLQSQLQVQSAQNNLLNRANRNCTAMVQPKNNIGSNKNTIEVSHITSFGQDHISQQSRNMVADQSCESAGTLVNQYNSCKNNETPSISSQSAQYQTTNKNHHQHQATLNTDIAKTQSLKYYADGSAAAHNIQRGAINETGKKTNRQHQQIKTNKSDIINKNKNQKSGYVEIAQVNTNIGHNNSQLSLKSQRSSAKISKVSASQNQEFKGYQHQIAQGTINSAISPANKSATLAKEQPFFQSQSFSSQARREINELQNRPVVPMKSKAVGSCTGSSEKYQTQNINFTQNQQVTHQIIVNGFHQKNSNPIMSSNTLINQGFGSKTRINNSSNSSRSKFNGGTGGSNFKSSALEKNFGKVNLDSQAQIQGAITQGMNVASNLAGSGIDSQPKSGMNSRKKQNQSTNSKQSHYTTEQKGKTVRYNDTKNQNQYNEQGNATPAPQSIYSHSSSQGTTLNSMRNLSGSLQKATITASGSIYKSQRGHYNSKLSSKNYKPVGHEHSLHNAKTMKTLGVMGTVGSESTALSRSGRSGDADRSNPVNQQSNQVHSSFSTSGIPRHPKLIHQKHSGTISNCHNISGRLILPNQKGQNSGSLTQNQTPNNLSHSNSQNTLIKDQQFYKSSKQKENSQDQVQKKIQQSNSILNSSEHLDTSICQVGGSGSTTYQHEIVDNTVIQYQPSSLALHSSYDKVASSQSHQNHQNLNYSGHYTHQQHHNPKIQRFDFRDYDSEEKLRIKPQSNQINHQIKTDTNQINQFHNNENQPPNFDQSLYDKANLRRQSLNNQQNCQSEIQRQQQIQTSNQIQQIALIPNQQDISLKTNQIESTQNIDMPTDLQAKNNKNKNAQELIQKTQKQMSQSKSTGKVNASDRTTEHTAPGNNTSPLGHTVQIDDGKLKHYQQMIQNVKFFGLVDSDTKNLFDQNINSKSEISESQSTKIKQQIIENKQSNLQVGQKQNHFKSLQIQIPVENGDDLENVSSHHKHHSQRAKEDSAPKDRSEGGQTSHSLLCGEENLLPSTEKKDIHSKISAQRIPKSGGAIGLMKTSTHLISNMHANRNIFLGKMPCNSTRNNSRPSHQIINEEFQLLFQKDKVFAARKYDQRAKDNSKPPNRDTSNDQNQETPKIMYKDRTSITSRILKEQVSFEKRVSPETISTKFKSKKNGSSKKKDQFSSSKKNQLTRTALMQRGTSQGPPITKNRDNRIATDGIIGVTNSSQKIISESTENGKNLNQKGIRASQTQTQTDREIQGINQTTLSKCIGIRSGSESNVKTNSNNIWNSGAPASNGGLADMEKLTYNLQDQRGIGIQPAHKIIIPNDDPTKTSSKRTGIVRAYAANTNQGLVRNYNEDRVSIITNLLPPKSRTDIIPEKWPRCSYFGIYDGHGGSLCADFLRDNLHQYVIMEQCFPANPKEAIMRGFEKAEKAFMDKIYNSNTKELKDKSGSCAIVVLIVQEICYVANVGDSRAVLSCDAGQKVYPLSLDHKPGEDSETKRIRAAGGQIYYRTTKNEVVQYDENKIDKVQQMTLAGPLRVQPGRLSVARTFGDPEAKIPELGGNPHVVIHTPEVKSFQIKKEHDFIVLGCDGIFDKMSNGDSVMCVWKAAHDNKYHQNVKGQAQDVHKLCGMGVEYILKNSLLRRSLDNVTVVVIGFSNLKHEVFGHQPATLQFKSDNDSCPENQLKSQSQVLGSTQKLQQAKKQNIVANSHRERESKTHSKCQDRAETGKIIERNRSANLPRDSCARQGISIKYQQTAQSNIKSQDSMQKPSRKYSSTEHTSEYLKQPEGSDHSSNLRANYSSSGGQKDVQVVQTECLANEGGANQTLSIKKQYQNLHGNSSTGQLHKYQQQNTARAAQSGHQNQKDGAKPPLSSQNNVVKLTNIHNTFGSQSTTPTNQMNLKAYNYNNLGVSNENINKNSLKAPRQSAPNHQQL